MDLSGEAAGGEARLELKVLEGGGVNPATHDLRLFEVFTLYDEIKICVHIQCIHSE